MNLQKILHNIFLFSGLTVMALAVGACQEEKFDFPDYTVSGKEVTVSVPVSIPAMEVKSRADLTENQLNEVQNLWVRTYSKETGEATSKWIITEPNTHDTEVPRALNFKTQSGHSYIVAVANVTDNTLAVTPDNLTGRPLSELLNAANTWNDFLNIAVLAPSTQEGSRSPQTPLCMVGCYSDLKTDDLAIHPTLGSWQAIDFQSYFIPAQEGTVQMPGVIHLRRIVSHLNFVVTPGDRVNVTVNSYQLMNVPRYSWLYEREEQGAGVMLTNFGNLAKSEDDAANYYTDIPQFGYQFVTETQVDGKTVSSFDLWQAENKHTGVAATYGERDLRYPDGSPYFQSLGSDEWSANQEASYILVNCTVDYKDHLYVNEEGEEVAGGNRVEVERTGEVTYLIHLGDIDGFTDFNCYRNVDYTYNLTINGVNDIRVDAYANADNPEQFNGEEGMVVDISDATIDLDAHYSAFNIQLTDQDFESNFGFIITTWENGVQYTITDANFQQASGTAGMDKEILDKNGNVIPPKYYNWIELRATTNQNTLAEYKPRYQYNPADGGKRTFLLTDLQGGASALQDDMKSDKGWYTVFVNEYTYEPMYIGTDGYANETGNIDGRPSWMAYVNQNPRRFYIRVTQKESPDGNSIYARSKYGVSQQSLMTYYSQTNVADNGTAIGVERFNETEGLNVRYPTTNGVLGGNSPSNGRWNVAQFLSSDMTTDNPAALSINSATPNQRPSWTNFVQMTQPLNFPAVDADRLQGGPEIKGGGQTIPALAQINNAPAVFTDPQPTAAYTINAINACMSRNRDNNGNGRIEPDELRWFLPAMNQYLQMVVGKNALPEPMMDYAAISGMPLVNGAGTAFVGNNGEILNEYYPRYLFVSSNNSNTGAKNVMWGMEGTSTSTWEQVLVWASNRSYPWALRCMRVLNADLTSVQQEDRATPPYEHDADNHTFRMNYVNLASVRTTPYTGNGTAAQQMPIHTIASSYNSVYKAFEYATEDVTVPDAYRYDETLRPELFNTVISPYYYSTNQGPCSGLDGTGWRVPNQIELTMMRNAGIFTTNNIYWLSCTVNCFQYADGTRSLNDITQRYFLAVISTGGTMMSRRNYSGGDALRVRCVRDIE